jgi:putative hydrolase of the HAD superfamily
VPKITTLFWDIGGVFLTNGWDRNAHEAAASKFGFDLEEFKARHSRVVKDSETGRLSLDEYLTQVLFYQPRPFTREAVRSFIFSCSHPFPETLAFGQRLARSGRYLIAALNNESQELNQYRIDRFGLRDIFTFFFSSCLVGLAKPDPAIYRLALSVTQRRPEECVFTDDRPPNLEPAKDLGMHTIRYENPAQLRQSLTDLGIQV